MSYPAKKHQATAERLRDWIRGVQNLRDEGRRLQEIFKNETADGTHENFVDVEFATVDQLKAGFALTLGIETLIDGSFDHPMEDRRPILTPFL